MNFQNQINEMTDQVVAAIQKSPIMRRTNEDRLKANGNIYFIYSNGQLKYIGQRQASSIKTRLSQHLFGKSFSMDENSVQNGTVSKWHKIKNEIDENKEVTFKTVYIKPDSLRTTIELELIARFKPEWNIQGKNSN